MSLAPWSEIEGYGSYLEAERVIQLRLQKPVIPVLVHLLEHSANANKGEILELLHDFHRLGDIGEIYQYSEERWHTFKSMTDEIRQTIDASRHIYERLATTTDSDIRANALHMLKLLDD